MDWNAIVGLVALVAGCVCALIGWIVRGVDRRLDAVEKKEDENGKDIAWIQGSLNLGERPKHTRD